MPEIKPFIPYSDEWYEHARALAIELAGAPEPCRACTFPSFWGHSCRLCGEDTIASDENKILDNGFQTYQNVPSDPAKLREAFIVMWDKLREIKEITNSTITAGPDADLQEVMMEIHEIVKDVK